MNPDPEIVRRTFRAELVRSLAVGVTETALATFAILIAVRQYESGPAAKALILGSYAFGMIGSLLVVPLAYRLAWRTTRLAAAINLFSGAGFLFAAFAADREWGFILGVCIGFFCMALPLPLLTQYWRQNIPGSRLGRMFSVAIVVRALATIGFSLLGGWLLGIRFEWFTWILIVFAGAAVVSAMCLWAIPSPGQPPKSEQSFRIFHAMRWVKQDRAFCRVLISGMAMGLGVLSANAVRVDFLANPVFGIDYSPELVALVAGAIPSATRLLTTLFWGILFDRMNFFRLRALVNVIFAVAIAFYFSTGSFWMIVVGSALLGCARGGGEILWNLWVTKLSPPAHAAEYMSVHTFFTGLRASAAPFLGFYVASLFSIGMMMTVSLALAVLSLLILLPLVIRGKLD